MGDGREALMGRYFGGELPWGIGRANRKGVIGEHGQGQALSLRVWCRV
jgi:hypothetical protein